MKFLAIADEHALTPLDTGMAAVLEAAFHVVRIKGAPIADCFGTMIALARW
jgi:hypothetical protein